MHASFVHLFVPRRKLCVVAVLMTTRNYSLLIQLMVLLCVVLVALGLQLAAQPYLEPVSTAC